MNTINLPQSPAPKSSLLHRSKTHQTLTPIISINLSNPKPKTLTLTTSKPSRTPTTIIQAASSPSSSSSNSDDDEVNEAKTFNGRDFIVRLGEALSLGFPIWVGSASLVALWRPPAFLWVGRNFQIVGLTLTMLGIGSFNS